MQEDNWRLIFGSVRPEELRSALKVVLPHLTRLQNTLSVRVLQEDRLPAIRTVAGVDVSGNRFSANIHAAIVLLKYPAMEVLEEVTATGEAIMPYVPGYLAFREVPVLLDAWKQLRRRPDAVVVDGHGISHPRGLGIASHLGVMLDLPSIGCAKSVLVGTFEDPGSRPGDWSQLTWKGRTLGGVLRTRERCKPIFVSIGHAIGLESAIQLIMACCRGYRLPEPTRQAHLAANRARLLQG